MPHHLTRLLTHALPAALIALATAWPNPAHSAPNSNTPNVIIVITDDQGYGDLGFTGNTAIQTPAIDQLRTQSTLLNNFHVDPTCAPTRAALMTGRYSGRAGVWHTIQGRNMLRPREVTMADVFRENGYATGLFGKWHLGDAYPYRPEDRGFEHAVYHQAGGIGQAPDYWGNDYFDDTYLVNGTPQRFTGYCTDIWFDQSQKFITAHRDQPFFAYISTNAPHGPFYCPTDYTDPYEGRPGISTPEFYGMVTNIDDNMKKLVDLLDQQGLADNTILIFMTDNGTGGGLVRGPEGLVPGRGYDGNMRGKKGSQYDGGHRVPFIIRWPDGRIEPGQSVENLTAHIDILPTLIDLCGLSTSKDVAYDGTSLRGLLYRDDTSDQPWPDRTLVVENQRVVDPIKWRKNAVMTDTWRLIDGQELYDLTRDPKQTTDIAADHPQVVERLRSAYEAFWADVSSEHAITSHIAIGSDRAPSVTLSSHDWLSDMAPPWNQTHVVNGARTMQSKWALNVEQAGRYAISLRRWPVETDQGINDGTYGKAFSFTHARLRIGDVDQTVAIPEGAKEITFEADLQAGITDFAPLFISPDLQTTPYYAYITHKPTPGWQTPAGMGVTVYDPDYGQDAPQKK